MELTEKRNFVKSLIERVEEEIMNNTGKMPENWDGIELRQYIADKFAGCVISGTMSKSRKRDYNNTVLVNNL